MYVCGIDVGTSAVRVLVSDLAGQVVAAAARALPPTRVDGPRREQDAEHWWHAAREALAETAGVVDADAIVGVAVDATSGTFVAVDRRLSPVGPGIMYNDGRAAGYGERINSVAGAFIERHGYRFKDNFALSRMLWMQEHDPCFADTWRLLHQSDFINARLCGEVTATDWSNALKTGCDLHGCGWPAFIESDLGFPLDRLPARVVAPGTVVGEVCRAAAEATGLRAGTAVVAGASDGTASLFACGASRPGDFTTALGTTVTIKGVSESIVHDPEGAVYCHRHPSGWWLPGGASNVGCAALNLAFAGDATDCGAVLGELDARVDERLPSETVVYPLGDSVEERFPFRKAGIAEFVSGEGGSRIDLYAAYLQGIAFVERWCYEKLGTLGARAERVFSTGGGSRSDPWLQLRADVLQTPLLLPRQSETAFGSAILAATPSLGGVEKAAEAMVRVGRQVDPSGRAYDGAYAAFQAACRERYGVG